MQPQIDQSIISGMKYGWKSKLILVIFIPVFALTMLSGFGGHKILFCYSGLALSVRILSLCCASTPVLRDT